MEIVNFNRFFLLLFALFLFPDRYKVIVNRFWILYGIYSFFLSHRTRVLFLFVHNMHEFLVLQLYHGNKTQYCIAWNRIFLLLILQWKPWILAPRANAIRLCFCVCVYFIQSIHCLVNVKFPFHHFSTCLVVCLWTIAFLVCIRRQHSHRQHTNPKRKYTQNYLASHFIGWGLHSFIVLRHVQILFTVIAMKQTDHRPPQPLTSIGDTSISLRF